MLPREVGNSRVEVGRVPFEVTDLSSAVQLTIEAAESARSVPIRLSNAYCVALADQDSDYMELLRGPGLNFPDGMPVVWFMKRRVAEDVVPGRVRGPSFFEKTLDEGRSVGLRHFLLGTTEDTLEKLVRAAGEKYPGVEIVGSYAPPFAPVDEEFHAGCVAAVSGTRAQIIWVALGTPKQDFLAKELADRTGMPCAGVGAAFDFTAGVTPEAPVWIQNSGLEWLHRLASEPGRLWRRYLFGNIRFLRSALRDSR